MIDGLKPCPAMKDSGVPWLGEVPKHWEVQRLRNLAEMRVSNVDKHAKEGEEAVRLCNYVDVYKNDYIRPTMSFMRATATKDEIARFRLAAGYIRAKQKLIKLLEEQKQAIIHRAVTGQIDVRTGKPYPFYKLSGVEWLWDVPEHWEVVRNGRLFVQCNETGFSELPILEVSLRTGVRVREFGTSDRKQVMADREKYKRAAKGDIAYNMMRMWQGAAGIAPIDGSVSPAYVVAKPLVGTEPRYFSALFSTRAYMGEVDKYSRGIVKDRNRLYWEDFKQMPVLFHRRMSRY